MDASVLGVWKGFCKRPGAGCVRKGGLGVRGLGGGMRDGLGLEEACAGVGRVGLRVGSATSTCARTRTRTLTYLPADLRSQLVVVIAGGGAKSAEKKRKEKEKEVEPAEELGDFVIPEKLRLQVIFFYENTRLCICCVCVRACVICCVLYVLCVCVCACVSVCLSVCLSVNVCTRARGGKYP